MTTGIAGGARCIVDGTDEDQTSADASGRRKASEPAVAEDLPRVHVVAYDIGDDVKRALVHKLLTGYGEPIQFSVFECWLTRRELSKLSRALSVQQLAAGDRVEIFRCAGDAPVAGTAATWWLV